jgi:hypothetical protein
MRISLLGRFALCAVAAIALLAGCGGPQVQGPATATSASQRVERDAATGSWTLPEAPSENLLYVANFSNVVIFSYPSGKVVGQLKGFDANASECVDVQGDVYVTNFDPPALYEYAHGGSKRIATYKLKQHGAVGCSYDVTTGNLAVIGVGSTVDIFAPGATKPSMVLDSGLFFDGGCAYDSSGDLFVDGAQTPSGPAAVVVLPNGSSTFSAVTLNDSFDGESDMHWDGTYLDLVAFNEKTVLRFSISGDSGVVAGKVNLKRAYSVNHFFIDDSTLIMSNWGYHRGLQTKAVLFYNYPGGGAPTFKLSGDDLTDPRGVVVSSALMSVQ